MSSEANEELLTIHKWHMTDLGCAVPLLLMFCSPGFSTIGLTTCTHHCTYLTAASFCTTVKSTAHVQQRTQASAWASPHPGVVRGINPASV